MVLLISDVDPTQNNLASKEATEVMQDAGGRWFKFVASFDTIVVLERKDLPEHLLQCPSIDRPVMLRKMLQQLEDVGEALIYHGDSFE